MRIGELVTPALLVDADALEHNLATVRYSNYEIFVGVYPNDLPTQTRVLAAGKNPAAVWFRNRLMKSWVGSRHGETMFAELLGYDLGVSRLPP
jgi:hypothetical protein